MTIQKKYIKSQEQAIASYDFTDITEGTGVVNFQGYSSQLSGASLFTYFLGKEIVASQDIETSTSGGTAKTLTFNTNNFNLPKIIKGETIIRFSGALTYSQVSASTLYFVVTLQKVSGGVVSDLGTATSYVISKSGNATEIKNFLININVSQTHFKIGDNLRLVIVMTPGGAGPVASYIAHDPQNRAGPIITPVSTYPTNMDVFIPFRIDL